MKPSKKGIGSPDSGIPPPHEPYKYLTPALIFSHNTTNDDLLKPSPDPDSRSLSSIDPKKSLPSSYGQLTERQFPDVSRFHRQQESSSGSSIHLSFSNVSFKRQATGHTEDDAITRSILDDISDHDLLYSSNRKPSTVHRIGISLLTDVELGKVTEVDGNTDSQKLGGLCSQFSAELRNTKDELAKLYRENKDLRAQIKAQEDHIHTLNVHYQDQTTFLKQELAELRSAVFSQNRGKLLFSEDTFTKPTIDTEEALQHVRTGEPCCRLF